MALKSEKAETMTSLSHLDRLEAESLHIFREVAAEFANPVMLYSIGKDSAVLLHLLAKAFYPAKPPLPLLPADTTGRFRQLYPFRAPAQLQEPLALLEYWQKVRKP